MIQQVYRWGKNRGKVLCALPDKKTEQDHLSQAARLYCGCSELPVYFQYPREGGVVLGRFGLASGVEDDYLTHQMLFEPGEETTRLLRARPVDCDRFVSSCSPGGEVALYDQEVASLADNQALSASFHAIDWVFGLNAELLASLIAAIRLSVQGQCHQVCVLLEDDEAHVTRTAQQLMEILMRTLPLDEAARACWSSLPLSGQFGAVDSLVFFAPRSSYRLSPLQKQTGVIIDLKKDECLNLPREYEPRELEAARALLAHDLYWMERVFRGPQRLSAVLRPEDLRIDLPDFEEGMSLRQYFDDWTEALLKRRGQLNNEAFDGFAHEEWKRLSAQLVSAAEIMPARLYLRDLDQMIQALRRREYAARLSMQAQTLVDMVALLLDSLDWGQLSLDDAEDVKLLRRLAIYARSLDDDSCAQVRTGAALRMFHLLLEPGEQVLLPALEIMEELLRTDSVQFDQVQQLLRRHVLAQCKAESTPTAWDAGFVVRSMLAYVRFVDGVPDLRRLNALEQVIRKNCGERAMRHYEKSLDFQRRRMSSHAVRRPRKKWLPIALYALLGLAGVGAIILLIVKMTGA